MARDNAQGDTNDWISVSILDVEVLKKQIDELKDDVDALKKIAISHENELKQRKQITNTYVDTVLNKIEILKNIIKKNIGNEEEFISPHLLEVESMEEQIKQSGKISDKQFKTLNDIYKKQKRV